MANPDDVTDYLSKIASFKSGHGRFTNDEGEVVEYDYFTVECSVNGEPYEFNVKAKGFSDKVAIMSLADDVA
jgi:hypothetical protein